MMTVSRSQTIWIAIGSIATVILALVAFYTIFPVKKSPQKPPDIKTAKQAIKDEKIDEAIKILENLSEENESEEVSQDLINAYFRKGDILIVSGKYEEGIKWYWKARNKFPDIYRTRSELIKRLRYLTRRCEEKQDYENATRFANELYSLTKSQIDRIEIVRLLNEGGEKDLQNSNPFKALGKFEEARKIDSTNQTVINNLSHTYRWIGDSHAQGESLYLTDLAIEYHLKAEELDPNIVNEKKIAVLYFRKFKILNKLGEKAEAEESLKQVARFDAELLLREDLEGAAHEYMVQAENCMANGSYKEAEIFLREALSSNPAIPYLYYKQTTRKFYLYYKFTKQGRGMIGLPPKDKDRECAEVIWKAWRETKKFVEKKINLNQANLVELKFGLDISFDKSIDIVEHRPYRTINELLVKKVLGKKEFDRINKLVTVR